MEGKSNRLTLAEYVAAVARLGMAASDPAAKHQALALIEARALEEAPAGSDGIERAAREALAAWAGERIEARGAAAPTVEGRGNVQR